MAITIDSQASNYASMHSPLYFVVSSTNTAQTNFKYVCDVHIGGNLVARLKSFPQPVSSKGIFDVSRVVRDYLVNYFKPNVTPTAFTNITSDIYVNYELFFGEEYGGTTYLNLAQTDNFAYNNYGDFFDINNTLPYTTLITIPGNFISSRDRYNIKFDKNKLLTQRLFVPYLASLQNTDFDFNLKVTTYNGTSSTLYTGASVTDRDYVMLDCSPQAINTYLGTAAIGNSTLYYDVELLEDTGTMDYVRVYLDCFTKSESYNLHFLNVYGGYDTMNFLLVNRQSRTGQKKSFSSLEYAFNSVTNAMDRFNANKVYYGGNTQFWGEQSISFKLTSDWIRERDYTWLKELIYSPEVYLEWNNYFIPVSITDSAWQQKKNYQDKQFNLELNIELASKVNSQFR